MATKLKMMVPQVSWSHQKRIEAAQEEKTQKYSVPPELMIVRDADRLDATGIIGFWRVSAFSGNTGRNVHSTIAHFYEKLKLLPSAMYTSFAKMEANKRGREMKATMAILEAQVTLSSDREK